MVDKYVAIGCEALPSMEGRTDHLRVARLLRDKLEAFIASTGKDGAELQTILDVAKTELANSANNCEVSNSAVSTKRVKKVAAHAYKQIVCGHSCLEHEELIRPSLWENLPRDLLPPIFARLPLPAIARLQSVSKAWQKNISSVDSDFSRELEAVNHSRVALISPVLQIPSKFQVNIYDVQAKEWHCYDMHVTFAASSTMGAADGGLVCFVSIELNGPLSIMVINPFTLASRNLPYPQNLPNVQPTMVHLSVDAQTGKYKVVVAGYNANDGGRELEAEVYNSETDHWTKIDSSERIYGHAFHWKVNRMTYQLEDPVLGPCVHAEGEIESVSISHMETHWQCPSVQSYVMTKNRLFVLHKMTRRISRTSSIMQFDVPVYYITEIEYNGSAWMKVAVHRCNPFELCPKQEYNLTLHAACGFLMVFADIGNGRAFYHESGWLYHVATKTWCGLPPLPVECNCHDDTRDLLCEISLSVVP